jgi:hypothetical protein
VDGVVVKGPGRRMASRMRAQAAMPFLGVAHEGASVVSSQCEKYKKLDTVSHVAAFIRARSPLVFCPWCIARSLGLTEEDVRQRLQVVVSRPDLQQHFALTRGGCHGCGRKGNYVELR